MRKVPLPFFSFFLSSSLPLDKKLSVSQILFLFLFLENPSFSAFHFLHLL